MVGKFWASITCTAVLICGPATAGPDAMTREEARHLIARTGFGAAPHEVDAMVGLSYRAGVTQILNGVQDTAQTNMPAWVDGWIYPAEQVWSLGQTANDLYYTQRWAEIRDLSGWWFKEMITTPSPLTERLTLFWSDHFATSFEAHEIGQWSAHQNRFFRANAAGNFGDLAAGVLADPSMLIYLDNVSNYADAPNENLGREFLELFTLGEGRGYTQADVQNASRVLTGYTVAEFGTPRPVFLDEDHDDGRKTLFGQTGRFTRDDLVTLTLNHPDFGPYIVEKLWRTFVSDRPDPAQVARLTQIWKDNDLDLRPLLDALLMSDEFWDPANRGRVVKSPVELLVGTVRSLGLGIEDTRDLVWMAEEMGQLLFLPPNVAGWPEGIEWINDATASGRATAITYMLYDAVDGPAPVRATDDKTAQQTITDPNDLRVGHVFVGTTEDHDEGVGGLFTLYDVGIGAHHWRSITFWLDYNREERETALYINTDDCAPDCFTNLPRDEDDEWLTFRLSPWFLEDHAPRTDDETRLMQAIATHMPALIAATKGQIPYDRTPEDADDAVASLDQMITAGKALARDGAARIGRHSGELVMALSAPGTSGLAGLAQIKAGTDLDSYMDAADAGRAIFAIPARTYADGRAWIDALPKTGPETVRAARALLAVPRQGKGQREEMIARDPDAVIRALLLSPEYQVK